MLIAPQGPILASAPVKSPAGAPEIPSSLKSLLDCPLAMLVATQIRFASRCAWFRQKRPEDCGQ